MTQTVQVFRDQQLVAQRETDMDSPEHQQVVAKMNNTLRRAVDLRLVALTAGGASTDDAWEGATSMDVNFGIALVWYGLQMRGPQQVLESTQAINVSKWCAIAVACMQL